MTVVACPLLSDQCCNAKLVQDVWKTGTRVKANEDGIFEARELKKCIECGMGEGGAELSKNAKKWRDLARMAGASEGVDRQRGSKVVTSAAATNLRLRPAALSCDERRRPALRTAAPTIFTDERRRPALRTTAPTSDGDQRRWASPVSFFVLPSMFSTLFGCGSIGSGGGSCRSISTLKVAKSVHILCLPIFAGTRLLMAVYSRTISTNSRDWRQLEGPAMEAGSRSHCDYCSEIEDLKVTLQLQCGGQRNCLQEKRGSLANGIKSKIEKPRILILGGALKL
nr:crocetin glucosyltransferase, chloroplastic-like [Ipomoea batatas]